MQRLAEYCDKMHKLYRSLDFKNIFEHYHKVHADKMKIATSLMLELNDLGVIQQKFISQKVDPLKMSDLIRDEDLEMLNKT